MVVVTGGDDVRTPDVLSTDAKASRLSALFENGLHFAIELEADTLFLSDLDHAFHDAVHAAHRVPRSERGVGVVHEAVEGRGGLWLGSQEEDGKLHQLDQPWVLEVLAHMVAEAAQELKAGCIPENVEAGEFEGVVCGFVDEAAHADVVLDLGFGEEGGQPGASARLHGVEGVGQRFRAGGDIEGALVELHAVGGVEAHEVVQLVDAPAELREVPIEDIGHPIPARPHVEPKPFRVEPPCPTAGLAVAFEDGHVESPAGQCGGRCEARKAGSDDGDVEVGVGVSCHGQQNKQVHGDSCSLVLSGNKVVLIRHEMSFCRDNNQARTETSAALFALQP